MESSPYSRRVLLLIFAISLFNYIDRQILYAVFPLIKEDLRLTDTELGFLASSFMIVYTLFAPFAGWFGDRMRRPLVIGASAIFWSAATFFSGLIKSYPQLILTRSLVGIGEAGYGPVSPSYLAEWFPPGSRARVMAFYSLAIPVGSAIGYLLGGWLGHNFGWRNAFFIVAVPGALLGAAALFLKENPQKKENGAPGMADYRELLRNKTFLLIAFSLAIATFSVGGLAAWMPSYFVRTYGLNVAKAGFVFGAVTVCAGIIGNTAGGLLADWLKKYTPRAYFIVGCLTFFASIPFGLAAVLTEDFNTAIAMIFMAETLIFMHSGPYHAAIVEITPLKIRSMAFAVAIFILHAFGDAVSPTIIGIISDSSGLAVAIFLAMLFLAFGGITSALAGYFYMREHAGKGV
ncbi:MAG: sugar phosphate permease [Elusimicrobia bacterium]|nr:MAG: sugar phosphate permease [Elusimicrobiota bacterium]KAF0154148.1 MAG: sugar phosphate permease [Elusimicrobiota bacterium]